MGLTQDYELVSCSCKLWPVSAGDREVGVVDTSDTCAALQRDLNGGRNEKRGDSGLGLDAHDRGGIVSHTSTSWGQEGSFAGH